MTFLDLSLGHPVIRSAESTTVALGPLGARCLMDGRPSDGRVAVVEHPIVPRGLAAPMHLHTREDEFSFIIEGRWGFRLADETVYAGPGDLVYKPRDVWHTFWNAGDTPGRILEVISPAGFEQFFVEIGAAMQADPNDVETFAALAAAYGIQADWDSVPRLATELDLVTQP